MAGNQKTRAELFEDFDAPFRTGNEPANSDFQDLGASYQHKDDAIILPSSDVAEVTMFTDEVFTAAANYIEKDPGGANRTLDPSGAFTRGHQLILVNLADAAETITFDSAGLNVAVAQNQRGIFVYSGAAWRKIYVGS